MATRHLPIGYAAEEKHQALVAFQLIGVGVLEQSTSGKPVPAQSRVIDWSCQARR